MPGARLAPVKDRVQSQVLEERSNVRVRMLDACDADEGRGVSVSVEDGGF